MKQLATVCLLLAVGGASPIGAHQQQGTPTFRAGVDLVVVDVVVINKDGVPVTDLKATDFVVTAGKRPRTIVSAEYVGTKRTVTADVPVPPPDVPAPTSNHVATSVAGRSILFVVDVDEIRAGEGRMAMKAISDYMGGLDATDHVGVVALPYGTPRVDLTTNHQAVRDAAELITGASRRMNESNMTPGEAAAISQGDTRALVAHWERASGVRGVSTGPVIGGACVIPQIRPIDEPQTVPDGCREKAERTLDVYRRHTKAMLDSMRAFSEAMAPLDGQKALVLVSEGIYNDPNLQSDIRRFASAAERARVALYAVHLDAPLMEAAATSGPSSASRILDDRQGFDGMSELAYAARGTAFRAIASPANLLKRIDTELSGHYLIAFERNADDRDGDHVGIDVTVTRPGLDVRARKEFTPGPATAAAAPKKAADPKVTMGDVLRWPVPYRDIPIDVDTFTMPIDAVSPNARVMIAADIDTGGRVVNVGFEVNNSSGKTMADSFDARAELLPTSGGRSLYPVTVDVPPGRYTLMLGVIAADGTRGSVTHVFDVRAWPASRLRSSSVILGEVAQNRFQPTARVSATAPIAVRFEVVAATVDAFGDEVVHIDITRVGATTAALSVTGQLSGAPGSLRRASTTLVDPQDLPSGDYVVRVTLGADPNAPLAQASRFLRKN
jgi:VWFA-related protein